jgi:hypothetical protein
MVSTPYAKLISYVFYTCLKASTGCILAAFTAGCKLEITAINITINDTTIKSEGEIDVSNKMFFIRPKEKWNSTALIMSKVSIPTIFPMIVLITPKDKPSAKNSHKTFEGSVPIAEIVPISLTRS